MKKLAVVLLCALAAMSCKPFDYPWFEPAETPAVFVQHVSTTGEFKYQLDVGSEGRSVFFTFVNPNTASGASSFPEVSGQTLPASRLAPPAPLLDQKLAHRLEFLSHIAEFNRDPFTKVPRVPKSSPLLDLTAPPPTPDTEGQTDTFNDYDYGLGDFYDVPVTCHKVVGPIDIGGGEQRTLNIWVANDCWTTTNELYKVDQEMVDALAAHFLLSGASNDIYDWSHAILGDEWGDHPYSNLIAPNDEITIFLLDIEDDNSPDGGIVGYFWAKDNFVKGTNPADVTYYSHERIMFYIDALMYANPDVSPATWSETDYWPEEIFSTLAHEFQHMINFYQKFIVYDSYYGADTWINEMCSQVLEDLLADKMGVIGPRGVDGADGSAGTAGNPNGRIPMFNYYDFISLSDWGGSGALQSYSATYAFGAYLARNYGGAGLLRDIVQCAEGNASSITNAVAAYTGRDESLQRLIERWSLAILASDLTNAPAGYRFNTGDFVSSEAGGASYNLGSINFFNYTYSGQSGPLIFTGDGTVGTTLPKASSSTFYSAGSDLTSSQEWTVTVPEGMTLSVLVK
jgi:hypothetical protein